MRAAWIGWAGCAAVLVVGCGVEMNAEESAGIADRAASAESAPVTFARGFGLTNAMVQSLARGRGGSLAVAGWAQRLQGIGNAPAPARRLGDADGTFVIGFDSGGKPRFSRFFPGALFGAVTIDDAGDTLVTGMLRGLTTFGEISTRTPGTFVVRLDPEGRVRWLQTLPWAEDQAIVTDAAGNVLVGGSDDEGMFLTRLSPSAEVAWSVRLWGELPHRIHRIAVDAAGRVVIAGTFSDHLSDSSFGGRVNLVSNGGTDVFVAAIEADGKLAWMRGYGGPGDDDPPEIALAPDGSILVAGTFSGEIDPGSGRIESRGSTRAYVASFAPDGRPRWAAPFDTTESPLIWAVEVTPSGGILVAGTHNGVGDRRPLLAALDGQGRFLKLTQFPMEGVERIDGLALEPSGSLVLVGWILRSITLGGIVVSAPLTEREQENYVLARIAP